MSTINISIVIGLFAGMASGLFGIGGGIIIVPMLLYFFHFSQQMATATSLIALLLPVGALGLWQYFKGGFVEAENIKIGLFIALGLFLGAFLGARIATQLSSAILTKMFSVFLVLVAVRLWFIG